MMASTARVIKAVVKNMPKEYFMAKEWLYLSVYAWRYMWTNLCSTLPMMNLLKRMTPNNATKTIMVAKVLFCWTWGSWGLWCYI